MNNLKEEDITRSLDGVDMDAPNKETGEKSKHQRWIEATQYALKNFRKKQEVDEYISDITFEDDPKPMVNEDNFGNVVIAGFSILFVVTLATIIF